MRKLTIKMEERVLLVHQLETGNQIVWCGTKTRQKEWISGGITASL